MSQLPPYGQFHRIELMIGQDSLAMLQRSRVIVAGLGAVGSFALDALARSGIGSFTLFDCDTIKPSNINRQLFAIWETVGQKKTEVAKAYIKAINPNAQVETFHELLNAASITRYFGRMTPLNDTDATLSTNLSTSDDNGRCHSDSPLSSFNGKESIFLVDAIDSLGPKVELLAAAIRCNIPFISSMGAARRTDPTLIRVGRLTDVTHCPLSALIRKRLRRRGINTDEIRCVYSPEEIRNDCYANPLSPECSEDDRTLPGRQRGTMGSLPTITGIFGLLIAHEVTQYLTGGFNRKKI